MEHVRGFVQSLSELYQELILNRKNSGSIQPQIKTQSQKLAACLKHYPDFSSNEGVVEVLALYAVPTQIEDPLIYPVTSKVVELCLKSLTPQHLIQMWNTTNDIFLSYYLSKATSIPFDSFFEKISSWIENPQPDKGFFRRFLSILRVHTNENIPTNFVLGFIPFLVDISPLRISMALLVLTTFKSINQEAADLILASWLVTSNKRPQSASACRSVLELAPKDCLNYAATLCLEFPEILCILPESTQGYTAVSKLTLHRVRNLHKDYLINFLECSPFSVRMLCESCDGVDPSLRLLDASLDKSLPAGDCLAGELTPDLMGSCAIFAMRSSRPDGSVLPRDKRRTVLKFLREPKQWPPSVAPRAVDVEAIISCSKGVAARSVRAIRENIV